MTTEILNDEMLSAEQLEGIAGGDFIPPAMGKPEIPYIPCPRPIPYVEPIRPDRPISIPASKIPQGGDFIPPADPVNPFIPCPRPIPYVEPIRPDRPISIPASKMFE